MKIHPFTALLPGAMLLLSSCSKDGAEKNTAAVPPVHIQCLVMKPTTLTDNIQVAGVVKALEDALVSPEEGGAVKAIVAPKGSAVRKGDVIILLKDEVMKASYEAAQAQYLMAQLNAEKQKKVYEEQGISELQYKNLLYARDAARANADLMKERLERTRIKSPFDGIVDNIVPNVGEFAPPGVPAARVVNTDRIKVQAEIPELYSGAVAVGAPVEITFDALSGVHLKGTVSFVAPTVSAANRTMMTEIVVPNSGRRIKPEMVAKVKLFRETRNDALMVPENVVQLVDRDRYVVYIAAGDTAAERRVTLGGREGTNIEVTSGLRTGDRLIVVGYQKLMNGTPVIVSE